MVEKPFDLSAEWDCVFEHLSEIHARRSEFHASVLDAINGIEQLGENLSSCKVPSEHSDLDQQIEQLTEMVADLTDFLTDHKRTGNREDANNGAQPMRRFPSHIPLPKKKRTGFAPRRSRGKSC